MLRDKQAHTWCPSSELFRPRERFDWRLAREAEMMEDIQKERLALAAGSRIAEENLSEAMRIDPRVTRFCCGHAIEPHLAEIRNASATTYFVSV